jgi:hypothetical protein
MKNDNFIYLPNYKLLKINGVMCTYFNAFSLIIVQYIIKTKPIFLIILNV